MEQVQGRTTLNSSSSAGPNPCPICLGPVIDESYLDRCFHRFCYACILRWRNGVSSTRSRPENSLKCPLCKTENFSIIFGYNGNSFQQHHVHQDSPDSSFYSEAHKYRLQCYYTEPVILADTFHVARYWKFSKYLQHNKWLKHWLTRELQALTQEEDVDILVHHILRLIESFGKSNGQGGPRQSFELRRAGFKNMVIDAVRPFLRGRTERFADELELFLASGLTIDAYDNSYKRHLGCLKSDETSRDKEDGVSKQSTVVPSLFLFDDSSDEAD